ncbi:MAG: Flp family type IVb pilin [Alcanivorax sp.]|nr:Flp family type IVb pilin [Alcanivorax sp.]
MKQWVISFWREEHGATMVEYAIMIALIAIVCYAVVVTVGTSTKSSFSTLHSTWDNKG